MIVDPDFLDHWKTRMLVNALEDEVAPVYVLRLWAHCQNRRQSEFDSLTANALKALCRYPGDANKLDEALTASGFICRDNGALIVCNWDEYNSSLIAAWENGKRGGRPRKKNPKETQGLPSGNPAVTQGQPTENPNETDKRGEDKSREEKNTLSPSLAEFPKKTHLEVPRFQAVWDRWGRHLLQKGKVVSPTSMEAQLYKVSGYDIEEAIAMIEYSIDRNALNLITNGDHKRASQPRASPPPQYGRKQRANLDEVLKGMGSE